MYEGIGSIPLSEIARQSKNKQEPSVLILHTSILTHLENRNELLQNSLASHMKHEQGNGEYDME